MSLETTLFSRRPEEWVTEQAVVFDWYDGPREGVARLESPAGEFYFQLLSENPTADDLDDRLFRVSELRDGSVSEIVSAIHTLGEPLSKIWIPVWRFASDREEATAQQKIDLLIAGRRETDVVIWTRDMQSFLGCWHAERNGTADANWFTKLGIAR